MRTTAEPTDPHGRDDAELTEFGYRPELKRTLGNFHTFAAGISYISILIPLISSRQRIIH